MTESPEPYIGAEAAATLEELTNDDEDDPTFDAPWQARAFALAVAVSKETACDWDAFQERFVERVQAIDPDGLQQDVEAVYFNEWLAALEEVLDVADLLDRDELAERQREFESGDRDESEFVLEAFPDR